MRGGYLHNTILIGTLQRDAEAHGWDTQNEVPVRLGESVGFIDLVIPELRIAIEAELTPARVPNDVAKAEAYGARILFIVTPTRKVAAQCQQRIPDRQRGVWVLPLGPARERLRNLLPKIPTPIQGRERNGNPLE